MENYKEKYEQLVAKLREARINELKSDDRFCVVIDEIIPELTESEDERIRKEIVDYLKSILSNKKYGDKFIEDWISWLEKQGEQKPVPRFSIGDFVKDTNYKGEPIYEIVYIDSECYICEYRGKENMGDRYVMHFSFDNPYLRLVQKPADKIEQNCYHDDGLYYAIDILEKTFGKVEGYQSDDGKTEYQIAIETVNALYHKKLTEWSEEDEKQARQIERIAHNGCTQKLQKQIADWFLSIKKRIQPKLEWGDEDEAMIDYLLQLIQKSHKEPCTKGLIAFGAEAWLKALKNRYTWRPSESHYELEEFAKIVRGNLTGISKAVQKLFEAKYLQLTGNKMYGGFKD